MCLSALLVPHDACQTVISLVPPEYYPQLLTNPYNNQTQLTSSHNPSIFIYDLSYIDGVIYEGTLGEYYALGYLAGANS